MAPSSKRHDPNEFPTRCVYVSMIVLFIGLLARFTLRNFFLVSAAITFVILFAISKERGLLYVTKIFLILDVIYLSKLTPAPSITAVASGTLKALHLLDSSSFLFRSSVAIVMVSLLARFTRIIPLYLTVVYAFEIPYVFPLLSLALLDRALRGNYDSLILSGLARIRSFDRLSIGVDVVSLTVVLYSLLGLLGLFVGLTIRTLTIGSLGPSLGIEGSVTRVLRYILTDAPLALIAFLTIASIAQLLLRHLGPSGEGVAGEGEDE